MNSAKRGPFRRELNKQNQPSPTARRWTAPANGRSIRSPAHTPKACSSASHCARPTGGSRAGASELALNAARRGARRCARPEDGLTPVVWAQLVCRCERQVARFIARCAPRVSLALCLCLLGFWAGCAGGVPVGKGVPAASQYSAGRDALPGAPAEVARFLEDVADARGFSLRSDARLAQLAEQLSERGGRMSPIQLELAVRRLGIYDPRFRVFTQAIAGDLAHSGLTTLLEDALRVHSFTHYGAVWGERAGVRTLTLVLSARRVWLSPVPSSVPLNSKLHLRGRLLEAFRNLRVEVLSDSGRALIPVSAGSEISVQLPAARPGLQRIELRGEGEKGVEILAKLPVYVDEPFPRAPATEHNGSARDISAIAQKVFASINRARGQAGLPALERDARLDGLARSHSVDMRDHDFVDHASARTGDAVQRVAQAGLPTPLVLESVARAPNPEALEVGPGTPANELGNILSRQVTHVGIGIAVQRDAYGELWIATELFVELPDRLDVAGAAPRLLGLLNEARVGRGASTVALDPGLSSVAVRAAEAFVADANATERGILAQADKELVRFSLSYRRVNALLVLTPRLQDAASLEPALDPDASGIGIGIAQGNRAGAQVVAIVMILGTRR